ncbi:MAG: Crp/Fnr family transcriptional regulator [Candidatus Kapaibacteriales bacterium]
MEEFIALLNSIIPLSDEVNSIMRDSLIEKHYRKKEVFHIEGERSDRFYFNAQGFVRLYYNVDGEEKTAFFYPKGTFVSDFDSYVNDTPSKVNFQALEDTRLIILDKENAEKSLMQIPEMAILAVRFMEMEMVLHQKLIKSILTESPEERYKNLLENSPEIIAKSPSKHIASYLGIAPEHLSRLKNKIHNIY